MISSPYEHNRLKMGSILQFNTKDIPQKAFNVMQCAILQLLSGTAWQLKSFKEPPVELKAVKLLVRFEISKFLYGSVDSDV